jgi:hypothetical protein
VRLRAIELGRPNADHAFIPAKRSPGERIDFVAPQARQRSEEEDLVLLGMRECQLLSGAFEQFCQVEGAPVARRGYRLNFDAAER